MKVAYSTLACPNWTLEQAIDAAKRFGYEGLELRLLDGELLQPDMSAETRHRVRRVCREAGLPIVSVDTSVKTAQPDAAAREAQIREGLALLEIAAEWEAPMMRVFGGPPPDAIESQAIEGAAECLGQLARRGDELGVAVVLETHDAFSKGAVVEQVLSRVHSTRVGVIWDILHPYRFGEPISDTQKYLGAWIKSIHIKDGRRPADGSSNWPLVPLGEGNVPTRDILRQLRTAGYDGWLVVEWEKKWHPELAEPEIALEHERRVLRTYLQQLDAGEV